MNEKFQVGQWVTCDVGLRRVKVVDTDETLAIETEDGEHAAWRGITQCKPFRWEVGRTYRTTLDGVTATIDKETTAERVVAWLSNGAYLSFSGVDGELMPIVPNPRWPTHLLPYLADATPPVAEAATEPDRFEAYEEFDGADERSALEILWAEYAKKREQCELEATAWTIKASAWREAEEMIQDAIERAEK